jgi:hypothetical protein
MNYDINKNFTGVALPIWVKKSRAFSIYFSIFYNLFYFSSDVLDLGK